MLDMPDLQEKEKKIRLKGLTEIEVMFLKEINK
jgi:hypothetical protein